jgi:hypothetical protein
MNNTTNSKVPRLLSEVIPLRRIRDNRNALLTPAIELLEEIEKGNALSFDHPTVKALAQAVTDSADARAFTEDMAPRWAVPRWVQERQPS